MVTYLCDSCSVEHYYLSSADGPYFYCKLEWFNRSKYVVDFTNQDPKSICIFYTKKFEDLLTPATN